ncbi:MAG: hypothetical protein HYR85_19915 [Planctomycetes bacterium]|nr:hypothetical protein [Planctomycetota bacterium]MBI3844496.1 hypothetical protein [Planctomycetota bacterium]
MLTTDDVKKLVAEQLERIADLARRDALAAILRDPVLEFHRWVSRDPASGIPVWILTEASEHGDRLAYTDAGFAPHDPWGYVDPRYGYVAIDFMWFTSLDDAFINSGMWKGPLPPDYEVA